MQSGSADVSDMRVGRFSNLELVTTEARDTLFDAAHKMDRKHVGALPVLDDRLLIGVISEKDIVKAVAEGADPATIPVTDYMTESAVTVRLQDDVAVAVRRMVEHRIRHLPVVLGHDVIGMLSVRDLLRAGVLSRTP